MENSKIVTTSDERFSDKNNNNSDNKNNNNVNNNSESSRSGEKYGLRPRTSIKRLHQEFPLHEVTTSTRRPSKSSKKPRPPPLSKYRRKTANARERHRMKAINTAFESLRRVLPDEIEVQSASTTMTKITTLRMAVDYIRALSGVLEDDSDQNFHALQGSKDEVGGTSHLANGSSYHLSVVSANHQLQSSSSTISPSNVVTSTTSLSFNFKGEVASQYTPHFTHLLPYGSSLANDMSASCSPSTSRGSLGSTSDFEELLSDDSGALLEDNLDVFHDIPTITLSDPFEVLLQEKEVLHFPSGF